MVYTIPVRNMVQEKIDSNDFSITNWSYPTNDYTFIPFPDISVNFYNNARHEAFLKIYSYAERRMTNECLSVWKQYAPGKFLIKDFMKNRMLNETETPYFVLRFTYNGNKLKVLVRRLIEENSTELKPHVIAVMKKDFSDLTINGETYTLIKISNDDDDEGCPDIWDIIYERKKSDMLHESYLELIPGIDDKIINNPKIIVDDEPEVTSNNSDEENEEVSFDELLA